MQLVTSTDDFSQSVPAALAQTLKAHPTSPNIEQFRITRASCRRIMRQSQRSSWRSYVSKINSNTPSRRIWNMLHKIQGKNTRQPVKHLKVNNSIITDTIANKTIPKTGISSYKIKNPWFTEECKKACKLRQKALRTLKAHPTSPNIEQVRITRASCRRIMRESQRSPKSILTLRHVAFGTCYIKYKGKIPVNLLSTSK